MRNERKYTDERNVQILIALMKAHGIRRVVASPGSAHMAFLGSIQYDPWFTIWSAVDERHAAYLALGMAAELGEPVALTCTGSTASRNYLPALTEAFYRKIPLLAITGSQVVSRRGNLYAQVLDRSVRPRDAVRYATTCAPVFTPDQVRACELEVSRAILELTRHGGGPVHIDLESTYCPTFGTETLPSVRRITRHFAGEAALPSIPANARVAVFIGSHRSFSADETEALERFLKTHDAVAVCDATSAYRGCRRIVAALVCAQRIRGNPKYAALEPDLVVHIGEMANDYSTNQHFCGLAPVWRVSEDGELRDRFGMLERVFEMSEREFFVRNAGDSEVSDTLYRSWAEADRALRVAFPDLPFSNLWIARQTVGRLPDDSILHLGVSTTLQSWPVFLQDAKLKVCANVGACGIDGCVSTLIGASLARPDRLCFGVVGDLTFFYDLNALGNRHVGKNLRILLVNNGCGALFHAPHHIQEQFADDLDAFMAAGGHFGGKSAEFVRHLATDLGFTYLCASDKDGFTEALSAFTAADADRPIIFECFTETADERKAWELRTTVEPQREASGRAAGRGSLFGRLFGGKREGGRG